MPFLPNFAYFPETGEISRLERAEGSDPQSITQPPALLKTGEEKRCVHQHGPGQ